MQKVGGLKYLAPNINVYVLMIFTAFSLKSGGGACPPCPPYSASYAQYYNFIINRNFSSLKLLVNNAECKIENLKWSTIFPNLHEFDWPCVQIEFTMLKF